MDDGHIAGVWEEDINKNESNTENIHENINTNESNMENAHANRFDIIDTVEIVELQHDSSENKNLNVDSNTIPYNKYVDDDNISIEEESSEDT